MVGDEVARVLVGGVAEGTLAAGSVGAGGIGAGCVWPPSQRGGMLAIALSAGGAAGPDAGGSGVDAPVVVGGVVDAATSAAAGCWGVVLSVGLEGAYRSGSFAATATGGEMPGVSGWGGAGMEVVLGVSAGALLAD